MKFEFDCGHVLNHYYTDYVLPHVWGVDVIMMTLVAPSLPSGFLCVGLHYMYKLTPTFSADHLIV
jgi:hypothetical protein